MKLRKLHTISGLVMLAWFASLGWLVQREYLAAEAPGDVAASARVVPGSAFYAVFLPEGQVGVASAMVDTMGGEVRLSERFEVTMGDAGRWRHTLDARLSPELELRSLQSAVGGDLPRLSLDAVRGSGDTVALELRTGESVRTLRRAMPGVVPAGALPLRLAVAGRPRIGQTLEALVLDPLDGSARERRYVVADTFVIFVADSARFDSARGRWTVAHGTDVVAWRLDEVDSDAPSRLWIDAQGFVVRGMLPSGFRLHRTAFEIAQLNLRTGRGMAGLPSDDVLPSSTWPSEPAPRDTMPELRVPSDAPAVRNAATDAAAGAANGETAARALLAWVARYVKADGDTSAPDALRALERRRGNAASRALLFVAMARARGVPARVVAGARETGGAWAPHVWAEVHAGRWVAVDPAAARWPADSTLVPLRLGGTGHPLEIAGRLARLNSSPAGP